MSRSPDVSQFEILEDIATGAPLEATLNKLAELLEDVFPEMLASIMVLQGRCLRVVSAPHLPSAYLDAIDGLEIGPEVGSCGSAAYHARPVMVEDIATDHRWMGYQECAIAFGLRACWSTPIMAKGKVLGTFAIYSGKTGLPASELLEWLSRAQHLASLALQSAQLLQDLRHSEGRFRTFVDHALDSMVLHDAEGVIVDVNRRTCETLGFSPQELIGQNPQLFDTDLTTERFEDLKLRLGAGEDYNFESHHRTKDGARFPVEVRLRPFHVDGHQFTLALVSDISHRKQSEAVVARQQQLLLETQQLSGLGCFEMDLRTGHLTWSDALYEIYGLTRDTFTPSLEKFLALLHDDDRESIRQTVQKAIETRSNFRCLERIVRSDGEIRTLESTGNVECDPHGQPAYLVGACLDVTEKIRAETKLREGAEALRQAHQIAQLESWTYQVSSSRFTLFFEDWTESDSLRRGLSQDQWLETVHPADRDMVTHAWRETLNHGTAYEVEHRMVEGGATRWVRVSARAEWGTDRTVVRVSGVTQDITTRRKLEEQFRESQKMEAIGRLAGGVAHDFNNLLTVINGWSELLENSFADELREEAVEAIKEAGQKAASLTAQLLAFSRRTVVEPKVLDVNQMVTDFGRLIRRLIGEHICFIETLDQSPAHIRIDPSQFEQMLMNLVVNARDAMPCGGQLTLSTLHLGSSVKLCISDSGEGIEPELLANIFEPFFTTKGLGSGTGLGLAVVHGVVTRWGGHVEVESSPQIGTTFSVTFPCVSEEASPFQPSERQVSSPGRETILLVEDDEKVRRIARIILEKRGYQVVEAALPSQALELTDEQLAEIHLLLTDVIMPGMGGGQMAEALRARRPDLPVLFMSGYTDDALTLQGVPKTPESFLQKPFSPEGLTSKVRSLLDQARIPGSR